RKARPRFSDSPAPARSPHLLRSLARRTISRVGRSRSRPPVRGGVPLAWGPLGRGLGCPLLRRVGAASSSLRPVREQHGNTARHCRAGGALVLLVGDLGARRRSGPRPHPWCLPWTRPRAARRARAAGGPESGGL